MFLSLRSIVQLNIVAVGVEEIERSRAFASDGAEVKVNSPFLRLFRKQIEIFLGGRECRVVKAVLFPISVNRLGPFHQDYLDIVVPATEPQCLWPIA